MTNKIARPIIIVVNIGFEKRQRIADIFAKVAEYTAAIVVLGSIMTKEMDIKIVVTGMVLFLIFLLFSVFAEPIKEEE